MKALVIVFLSWKVVGSVEQFTTGTAIDYWTDPDGWRATKDPRNEPFTDFVTERIERTGECPPGYERTMADGDCEDVDECNELGDREGKWDGTLVPVPRLSRDKNPNRVPVP